MKKSIISVLTTAFMLATTAVSPAHAGEKEGGFSSFFSFKRLIEIRPVSDKVYNEECGSCHFAYQPGLLPEDSWKKLLDAKALEDHFGDNAELENDTRLHILNLLIEDSADKAARKRSKKLMASLREERAPLRITQVPYIKRRHSDIPQKLIKENPKVKSLSQCNKCHRRAEEGVFDDDTVMIPNYGYWNW